MLPPNEIFLTQPGDGPNFRPMQKALAHVAAGKKLIVLNGDRSYCQFAEALAGCSRTLAIDERNLDEFLQAAATLAPTCVDSRFFQHMLEFATPLECSYAELSRVLEVLYVDADTQILLRNPSELLKTPYLAERFDTFITLAQSKGASLVQIQD
jgi:hypothetical protein